MLKKYDIDNYIDCIWVILMLMYVKDCLEMVNFILKVYGNVIILKLL